MTTLEIVAGKAPTPVDSRPWAWSLDNDEWFGCCDDRDAAIAAAADDGDGDPEVIYLARAITPEAYLAKYDQGIGEHVLETIADVYLADFDGGVSLLGEDAATLGRLILAFLAKRAAFEGFAVDEGTVEEVRG